MACDVRRDNDRERDCKPEFELSVDGVDRVTEEEPENDDC